MTTIDTDDIIPGTDVTIGDLIDLGHRTMGAGAAMLSLGHGTIGGLCDYVVFGTDRNGRIMEGIVRSALIDPIHKEDSTAALEAVMWDCGWMHRIADLAASDDVADQIAEAVTR